MPFVGVNSSKRFNLPQPAQMRMSGLQMPDYEGGARVSVPATGEGPQIVIEMKPTQRAQPSKPDGGGRLERL